MRPLTFAVIGTPIGHSKSPLMHEAAYRAAGLPHRYVKIDTPEAELPRRIAELREGVYAGFSVTVPHKESVLALVDEVAPSAREVGASNTLVRDDSGRIHAHNTDVEALRLELEARSSVAGKAGLVIGNGGAARAAVVAFAQAGATHIVVRARSFLDPETAQRFVASFRLDAVIEATPLESRVEGAELRAIIQATNCGMTGGPPGDRPVSAVGWETVPKDTFVLDVIYKPRETPFLARARACGLPSEDGTRMLALQGALAYRLWLGGEPPFDAMLGAVVEPSPASIAPG